MKLLLTRVLAVGATALILLCGSAQAGHPEAGAVYVASNAPDGNEVLVFARTAQGHLAPAGAYPTGGDGTGGGLGNQGGLVLSTSNRMLYVVNAGSDSISAFAVGRRGLRRIGAYPSGGSRPVSIAVSRRLLYVVHAGGSIGGEDSVVAFRIRHCGSLEPIPGSSRPLSAVSTAPAQVGLSAHEHFLLVTEKATDTITVFPVEYDGTLGPGFPQPSVGATPFGFDVGRRGRVFVSEAFGGAADASAVTAYELDRHGNLIVLDPSVPTTETAACWFVITRNGRFGYTTNTASGTLSGFAIGRDGRLRLLDPDGVTAESPGGPIDVDFSRNSRFLYVLNASANTLGAFRVHGGNGSLQPIQVLGGLPAGANGLAAR